MMAAAALVRSARCHACRYDAVYSFLRISGHSTAQSMRLPNEPQTRRFFTTPYLKIESSTRASEENISIDSGHGNSGLDDSANSSQSVPWYLQVDPVGEVAHPLAKGHEIPTVPENAPAITHDILQHLSAEIGLDDIKLLDLRGRDPPPALGVNVIMIVATARGIKHLNVSADRFCRWLRSKYKLRPDADGLLGRNELKIKLRRKARRARLASSSGTLADSSDDGITTGWICVNVGSVDDPSASKNIKEGDFEGFGKVQGGSRIVVQLFTEEKRADIDLEKLWSPKPKRGDQETNANAGFVVEKEHQVRLGSDMATEQNSNQHIFNISRPFTRNDMGERRKFSTTCKRQGILQEDQRPREDYNAASAADAIQQQNLSPYDVLIDIKGLSQEDIIEQLGGGPEDTISTKLLRKYYVRFGSQGYSNSLLRLIFAAVGVTAQHPEYTKEHLWTSFLELTGSGYPMRQSLAIHVASAFLVPRLEGQGHGGTSTNMVDFDVESALRVLDFLSLRGESSSADQRLFNVIYKALVLRLPNESTKSVQAKAFRLRSLMKMIDFMWEGDVSRETMQLRLMVGDVDGFYEIWHAIAFYEGSRTAQDYETLFRVHAEVGNSVHARECLAIWISMMARESPTIEPNAALISAIAGCAHVAGQRASEFRLTSISDKWQESHPLIVLEMEALEQLS